jgi:hypothetical protein
MSFVFEIWVVLSERVPCVILRSEATRDRYPSKAVLKKEQIKSKPQRRTYKALGVKWA